MPAVVGFAIIFLIVAHVKEFTQEALTLEEIGTVIIFYRIVETGV